MKDSVTYPAGTAPDGVIQSAELQVFGDSATASSIHVYTDEFGQLASDPHNAARSTLTDTGSSVTLNASAVSGGTLLDLLAGSTDSVIAGRSLAIAANTNVTTAYGGAGGDTITGNNLGDNLYGGQGNDTITGGSGNDIIGGYGGADTLNGGGGNNTVSYAWSTGAIVANLITGTDSTGSTLANFQNIIASNYGDTLTVGNGAHNLTGGNGNDTFMVGTLSAGSTLQGGGGTNTLVITNGDVTQASISSMQLLQVNGTATLTASQIAGMSITSAGASAITIKDTAANVIANLASLQTLTAGGYLSSIILTDASMPTVSLTTAQASTYGAALDKITSANNLMINWASGGSQKRQYNGLPAGAFQEDFDYSGANGTGTLNDKILDWTTGGSQKQQLTGLPSNVSSEYFDYSGPDATGTLKDRIVNYADTLTMNTIDGNNFINAAQVASGITIGGTATDSVTANIVGRTVTVAFNGVNYTGTVASGGTWSVSIPASALSALTDGAGYLAQATVTDSAGYTATAAHTATIDRIASLTMNTIDGNNFISAAQAASGITISGTATDSVASNIVGRTVTMTFNGVSYTSTVASGGTWSVSVPASALSGLTDGTGYLAQATITDAAGNPAGAAHTATVDKTASLAMNVINGNNLLNASQASSGITISGTATDSVMANIVGQAVTVTLNGKNYFGAVASGGTWAVTIPSSGLLALADGASYAVVATVGDKLSNTGTASHTLTVDKTLAMTMNVINGNNFINAAQIASGITISGTAADSVMTNIIGRTVTVAFNGVNYTGTVASNGTWSVAIPSSGLSALADGMGYLATATVTDKAGNAASTAHTATVDKTASATINPIDGNGTINGSNIENGITINGTTTGSIGNTDDAGRTLTIMLNGKSYAATVGSTGAWSVNVPSADLSLLTDGNTYTVTASGNDKAGNPIYGSVQATVDGAVVNWGSNSGNWGTAASWQGGIQPGVNDLAALNLASGETATYSTGNTTVNGMMLSGSGLLDLSGGSLTVSNAVKIQGGTLELDSGAMLTVSSGFANSGMLNAKGGMITINGTETAGTGSATISGAGEILYKGAASDNVTFASGATGELALGAAELFTGTISGFTGTGTPATSDKIDLADIHFSTLSDSYSNGILTIGDGTHTAHLHFSGSYSLSNFKFSNDGSGGTLVIDPPVSSSKAETSYQKLVQGMASFGPSSGPLALAHADPTSLIMLGNVAHPVHQHLHH